nr:MAG TPA: hypothetical protein [Caudoviricetes sp.]
MNRRTFRNQHRCTLFRFHSLQSTSTGYAPIRALSGTLPCLPSKMACNSRLLFRRYSCGSRCPTGERLVVVHDAPFPVSHRCVGNAVHARRVQIQPVPLRRFVKYRDPRCYSVDFLDLPVRQLLRYVLHVQRVGLAVPARFQAFNGCAAAPFPSREPLRLLPNPVSLLAASASSRVG